VNKTKFKNEDYLKRKLENKMSKYKAIKTDIQFGNILKITLNRPNKKNAFNSDV
jgi:1,4-dihydroxy-2-naphthoyl-CoA synthase